MSRAEAHPVLTGLPPEVGRTCRLLILGSMPGARSLAAAQYYAHPRNLFWPFMGRLFDAGPELAYRQRLARLAGLGIGLWDVIGSCRRDGSLDSAIDRSSVIADPVASLIRARPTLVMVALNGARARQAFERHVAPRLDDGRRRRLSVLSLPSTSPANASQAEDAKFARWCVLRAGVADRDPLASARRTLEIGSRPVRRPEGALHETS